MCLGVRFNEPPQYRSTANARFVAIVKWKSVISCNFRAVLARLDCNFKHRELFVNSTLTNLSVSWVSDVEMWGGGGRVWLNYPPYAERREPLGKRFSVKGANLFPVGILTSGNFGEILAENVQRNFGHRQNTTTYSKLLVATLLNWHIFKGISLKRDRTHFSRQNPLTFLGGYTSTS